MAYAKKTEVPFERSIAEIVGSLRKAGATKIGQMEDAGAFELLFELDGRLVRFRVRFPDAKQSGPRQDPARVAEQWRRQRGRALALVIKAKLESVESEVETIEQAFLANVVMADGATVHDRVRDQVALEYETKRIAPMMLEGRA